MSNYTKSFNFRNGVQVDDSNFIVNAAGLVGIGTTKPEKTLDVRGNAKISGITSLTGATVSGVVTVGAAITMDATSGIISATKFVGDASLLTNIVAIATDGWIANTGTLSTTANVGVGTLSPTSQLDVLGNSMFVGVSTFNGITTSIGSLFATQFSSSGVSTFKNTVVFDGAIDSNNDVDVSGHTVLNTAVVGGISTFSAAIDANGGATIDNIQIGVTGDNEIDTSTGNLTIDSAGGIVTVDDNLIVTGIVSAADYKGLNNGAADFPSGITASTNVSIASTVGFGTTAYFKDNARAVFGDDKDLNIYHDSENSYIKDSGTGDLVILSNEVAIRNAAENEDLARFIQNSGVELYNNNARKFETISVGASVYGQLNVASYGGGTNGMSTHFGSLRYGNENPTSSYSTRRSLDLINTDSGNINFYLNSNNIGVGETGAAFYWHKGFNNSRLMTLTGIGGSLGVGTTLPLAKLHVLGKGIITDEVTFNNGLSVTDGNVTISKNLNVTGLGTFGHVSSNFIGNVNANSGISTFSNLLVKQSTSGTGIATVANLRSGKIGINVLASADEYFSLQVNTDNKIFINSSGQIGIKTTLIPAADVGINARDTTLLIKAVGIGTTQFRNAAVDMANAGLATSRYMTPPTVDNTGQSNLVGMPIGSIIFNSQAGQHRWWNGSMWKNLGDYS